MVSDLPGSTARRGGGEGEGEGSRAAMPAALEDGGVKGHGWATTARCALLMASATFLEEVLGMG